MISEPKLVLLEREDQALAFYIIQIQDSKMKASFTPLVRLGKLDDNNLSQRAIVD
jgi:hypothetical protein